MLKEIIEIIKDTCLKYKTVKSFKYQDNLLINAQNNNQYLQCILEDTSIHNLNITPTPNIFISEFNLYVLAFPTKDEESILENQNLCYDAAIRIINKISDVGIKEYLGLLDVHDYSIITLSHFTDDNAVGVRCTISLEVPLNICDLDDYFNDDIIIDDISDKNIDIDIQNNINKNIILNPIKLPKNKCNK